MEKSSAEKNRKIIFMKRSQKDIFLFYNCFPQTNLNHLHQTSQRPPFPPKNTKVMRKSNFYLLFSGGALGIWA